MIKITFRTISYGKVCCTSRVVVLLVRPLRVLGTFHAYPGFLKTEIFPLHFSLYIWTAFSNTKKRRFSKTVLWVEVFENARLSFTCGRAKTEIFEYDDVTHHHTSFNIHHILLALRMLCKWRYRISIVLAFSVFMWTGENDSNTLRVDGSLRFQKYPDTCGQSLGGLCLSGPLSEHLRNDAKKWSASLLPPPHPSPPLQRSRKKCS